MIKKRVIIALKLIFIFVVPFVLWAFASVRHQKRPVQEMQIRYLGNNNVYITDNEVKNTITQGRLLDQIKVDNSIISQMESRIDAHQMVKNAEVYLSVDGVLNVDVLQRSPIARVWQNGSFYYMDDQGKKMPLSDHYSQRVLLVSGEINSENSQEIYNIVQWIRADDFLEKNVTVLQVLPKKKYQLYLRIPHFKVMLGDSRDFLSKINKLKAFYKKAEQDSLLNLYDVVDLQYDNQVVATKAKK